MGYKYRPEHEEIDLFGLVGYFGKNCQLGYFFTDSRVMSEVYLDFKLGQVVFKKPIKTS